MLNFKNKRILVVVAHPDDEVLGPGASIHRLVKEENSRVRAVILGEGITSRDDKRDNVKRNEELNRHRENIQDSTKIIGYESVGIYDLPDNRFDSVPLLDIIKLVENEKKSFEPEIIFTHHGGDLNIDHRSVFQSVMTAARPMPGEIVKSIITFETPSATEWQAVNVQPVFQPNFFISFGIDELKKKIAAMECYEYEKRDYPHPRSPLSLEYLSRFRGSSIGKEFAEAFQIIRSIS